VGVPPIFHSFAHRLLYLEEQLALQYKVDVLCKLARQGSSELGRSRCNRTAGRLPVQV
jgi:hypothetical protein